MMRKHKVVPSKVIFIKDNIENMINYYLELEGVDEVSAELLAEEE